MISYKEGYKYQLSEPAQHKTKFRADKEIDTNYINLDTDGLLTVKKSFAWDGATYARDTPTIIRGSLIHDALCQLINEGLLPKRFQVLADNELRQICLEDGMSKIRAWWVYRAVRRFDKSGLKKHEPKEVLPAP